jgi:pyrroloquinoline quinone biosynthesis protein D
MIAPDENSRPRLGRGVRLKNDPLTGEPLLLFPEGVYPLDGIAHDVLCRCSGDVPLKSIIDSLCAEYEADRNTVRDDVCECLAQLRQQMLIVFTP